MRSPNYTCWSVCVFIYPNAAAQVAVTTVIAVFFIFVSEMLVPYASPWNTWIGHMGHGIVFRSIFRSFDESGHVQ